MPFFDEEDGRYVHFQGTYSTNFFDSAPPTPAYEYNQIAYRLDLSTIPQLSVDVNVADFNADGLVDQFDLETWTSAFGSGSAGDTNDDNLTNGRDFLAWQRQFGSDVWEAAPLAASTSIPEPRTATLVAMCFVVALAFSSTGRYNS